MPERHTKAYNVDYIRLMVDNNGGSPHVAPERPKGSGSRAPWIVLAVAVIAVAAAFISIGIVILLLRG